MQTSGRNRVIAQAGTVTKVHGGTGGADRAATSVTALAHAAANGLQVPELLDHDGPTVVTRVVPDVVTGASMLATSPSTVLHAIGSIARQLHSLPAPTTFALPATGPAAWVHGDLCPVNLLFGDDHVLRAVVDWEDSHLGDPLVDLAWTEWLVRTWHHDAVEALPVMYAAWSRRTPDERARRTAMATCLRRHRARDAQATDWDAHLAALDDLDLSL